MKCQQRCSLVGEDIPWCLRPGNVCKGLQWSAYVECFGLFFFFSFFFIHRVTGLIIPSPSHLFLHLQFWGVGVTGERRTGGLAHLPAQEPHTTPKGPPGPSLCLLVLSLPPQRGALPLWAVTVGDQISSQPLRFLCV